MLIPETPISKHSITACFQKLAETNYVSFQGYLKCGNLDSRILLSPAPMVNNNTNKGINLIRV